MDSGNGIHAKRPRVLMRKQETPISVMDIYNIFVYRTWILETEYMHCVTQGGRYVNSGHRQGQWTYSFNMFVYRTWILETEYMHCVTQSGRYESSGH